MKFIQGLGVGVVIMLILAGGLYAGDMLQFGEESADNTNEEHDHSTDHSDDTAMTDDMADGTHQHAMLDISGEDNLPTMTLTVYEDAKSGFNVQIETTNFTFAPEHASTEHVAGEGHAHVYVDGVKLGRVYGEWYHVDGLSVGIHEITVNLNTNDHAALMVDGAEIADSALVEVGQ